MIDDITRCLCRRAPVLAASLILAFCVASPTARGQTAPPAAAKAPTQPGIPDAYKLSMLIRTTLIALSQANQTGNYSVLRDLGTPQFQGTNTDARLGEVFAGLRSRRIDFSPILFFDPKIVRPPAIEGGILRLTGFIPTTPQRILFDMGFEQVGVDWRLAAIVIDVQDALPQTAAPQAGDTAAKNEKRAAGEKVPAKKN